MFKLSNTSKKNLEGVNPKLLEIIDYALTISKIDFGIPNLGGLRTPEEQFALFEAGLSQLDGINKKSYHQSGNAFDIFAYVDGKASWDSFHLTSVAAAILQSASHFGYKLEWGGLWRNFIDLPHFQLVE